MPKIKVDAGGRPGIRAVRQLTPLAAVLAAVCCVSACGGGTASGTHAQSPAPRASSPAPSASAGSSSPAGGGSAGGGTTPGAALADYIHQLAAGHRKAACQDMGNPGFSAQRGMTLCMSARAEPMFTSLHRAFVTDGVKPSAPVSVTGVHATGTKATASAKDIHVSGTTLYSLMMAHSTGVKPGQATLTFPLSRVHGTWYVSGMNLNVGGTVPMGG